LKFKSSYQGTAPIDGISSVNHAYDFVNLILHFKMGLL